MGERLLRIEGLSAIDVGGEVRHRHFELLHSTQTIGIEEVLTDEAYFPMDSADRYQKFAASYSEIGPVTPREVVPSVIPHLVEAPRNLPVINISTIHELLDKRNESTPYTRVGGLIQLAFNTEGRGEFYQELPEDAEYTAMNIRSWLNSQQPNTHKSAHKTRLDLVKSTLRDKNELSYLHEDTAGYQERYEWLDNAEHIAKLIGVANDEPQMAAVAIRIILRDAVETEGRRPA